MILAKTGSRYALKKGKLCGGVGRGRGDHHTGLRRRRAARPGEEVYHRLVRPCSASSARLRAGEREEEEEEDGADGEWARWCCWAWAAWPSGARARRGGRRLRTCAGSSPLRMPAGVQPGPGTLAAPAVCACQGTKVGGGDGGGVPGRCGQGWLRRGEAWTSASRQGVEISASRLTHRA